MIIDSFTNDYRFLSNFYPVVINHDGIRYASVEHAYQAAKTLVLSERYELSGTRWDVDLGRPVVGDPMSASAAKRYGNRVTLRPDWEFIKLDVMHQLVLAKFQHPRLMRLLYDTVPFELVEGNAWNDRYWGVCDGIGENHIGKILMAVRDELRATARCG